MRTKTLVTLMCEFCRQEFRLQKGHYESRTRAAGHPPKYCSRYCMGAANRAPHILRTCEQCGGDFVYQPGRRATGTPRKRGEKFCSKACQGASITAAAADPEFEGYSKSRRLNANGYVVRRTLGDQKVTLEHTLVMEKIVGRRLFVHESVHHKNGVRSDNSAQNLELWSSSHPPGQRVEDKLCHAAAMLREYGVACSPPTLSEAISGCAGLT